MKAKFKAGDRVIPTDDRVDEGYFSAGYSYEVIDYDEDGGNVKIEDDDGDEEWWCETEFSLEGHVEHSTSSASEGLVGQVVTYNRKKYTIDNWSRLIAATQPKDTPKPINDIIEKFGFCFCVTAGEVVMPTSRVKKVDNRIVLTSDYNALISKDVVNVGCQAVPYTKVLEIVAVHKALFGN